MTEIWRDIPEYEGFYQASNLGRIRSLDRDLKCEVKKRGYKFGYFKKGRILKQGVQRGGYKVVSISVCAKRKVCTVHRLVAKAFLENPCNYREVNHKDGNKTNNAVENLEWCEHSDNIKHSYQTLGQERHHKPVRCIDTGIVYKSCKEASDLTGICTASINHAIHGITKTAGGKRWKRV